ncbi:MAG: DsbA family protein [Actinomycetota bacterium]|nr:DsbA family protein [Actinomycetota bacterium]
MGNVIFLAERLADRSRASASSPAAFFFDLVCPFSYLAAERVERILGEVEWVPTPASVRGDRAAPVGNETLIDRAERRANELRLPLIWPDPFPADCTEALRAAGFAAEQGEGARFALAASRLAFCGGFDLADTEILAAAAEAAGLRVDDCLAAAKDPDRDAQLEATARGLLARGVGELPAIRVERRWFEGERSVTEASALLRARTLYERPLAPAG